MMRIVVAALALAAVVSTSSAQCCTSRTFQANADTYEPIPIDQRTIFVGIQADSGLNDSAVAVRNAAEILKNVRAVLANSSLYPNITGVADVGITVTTRTNYSCDENFNCYSYNIGYSAVDTLSFNAPLPIINDVITTLLGVSAGVSIQNQQSYIPPDVFGAAQLIALERAVEFAQYRAERLIAKVKSVKLGPPNNIYTNTNDYLSFGGSVIGSVYASASITYDLIPV
jgi:hypothetical protein